MKVEKGRNTEQRASRRRESLQCVGMRVTMLGMVKPERSREVVA